MTCKFCKMKKCVYARKDVDASHMCAEKMKHKTRADIFRASTDDELAEMLCLIAGGLGPVHTEEHKYWLNWLKQGATFNAETETTICKDGGDTD